MKLYKGVRNVLSSGLAATIVLTGIGFSGGVADAATKSTSSVKKKAAVKKVVKKFDYAKYRKDQTTVVNGYMSTISNLDRPEDVIISSYMKDSSYVKQVKLYNVSSSKYRSSYELSRSEALNLVKLIKTLDTSKEKASYEKRVAVLKTGTTKLKTESRYLVGKGQMLAKEVTGYEKRKLALFEAKYGDIGENLTLIDFQDYLDYLDRNLYLRGTNEIEINAKMEQASNRMLASREKSSVVIAAKKEEILTLIYAGKTEEAKLAFMDAIGRVLMLENDRLEKAYSDVISSYMDIK